VYALVCTCVYALVRMHLCVCTCVHVRHTHSQGYCVCMGEGKRRANWESDVGREVGVWVVPNPWELMWVGSDLEREHVYCSGYVRGHMICIVEMRVCCS